MKAIGAMEFGGPGALQAVDLPEPQAGPGELRIRVRAAAVNPTDTGLRSGARAAQLRDIPPPYVPGMDAAGVLDQIGAGVSTDLAVGDDVMAIVVPQGAHGAYAEYVVIADASPADEQLVRDLGADIVLPRGDDFPARVREARPGGADGLIDAALLDERALPAVRDGGRIATVRGYGGPAEPQRGITFYPVRVRDYAREQARLDELRRQAEAGQLTLRVARTLPAGQAADAHRALEAGGVRGRIILEF